MDSQLDMQNTDTHIFIQTDLQFWNLVVGDVKKSHKASRAQAFRDLLERQYIEHLKGKNKYISATVKELAKSWGWDRMTVVKFLTSLEQLDVLTLDTLSNKKFFAVKYSIRE